MWVVSDHSNHCVYIFDSQDQLVKTFGSKGKSNGQFDGPAGLAFDDDNNLYVVCTYVGITTECKNLLPMVNICFSLVMRILAVVNRSVH